MQQELLNQQDVGFTWLDLYAPEEDELLSCGLSYGLPLKPMHDSLDLGQLPKYEEHGETHYFLIRRACEQSSICSGDFEEVTQRIAVFFNDQAIITIHRIHESYMRGIRDQLLAEHSKMRRHAGGSARAATMGSAAVAFHPPDQGEAQETQVHIVAQLLRDAIYSYENAFDAFDARLDRHEDSVFHNHVEKSVLEGIYLEKRALSAHRRMLRLNVDVIRKLEVSLETQSRTLEYLFADGERFLALLDGAIDNIHTLLNMHMSSQSNHTNETVRVLTIFSAFFMPLTFMSGVYGMNFKFMVGTDHELGFPIILLSMGGVASIIYTWFKYKRWIG
jgi:magnesium transporter